jgi:DNA (cytosine-5)-methyltransferase 1
MNNIMDIQTDLNKLTVRELRSECKNRSISGYSRKTRQELVELLRQKDTTKLSIREDLSTKMSKTKLDETRLTHVDLFAGIGAFTHALRNVATTIMANDICPDSEQIFKLNYPEVPFIKADVKTITVPYADIITAGFPCQSFSIAGKRDLNDPRATLIDTTVHIILTNKPKFFILENVRGFMSINNGEVFNKNIKQLSEFYHIDHDILNTCDITNIPQNRERIFIVGSLLELGVNVNLKFPSVPNMTMAEILEPEPVESKYYYDSRFKDYDKIKAKVNEEGYFYQYRRTDVRKLMGGKCPCLTANMGTGGHNVPLIFVDGKIRKLTSLELSRLQGIPDSFNWGHTSYSDRARLIGNSITFKVVELIINKMM